LELLITLALVIWLGSLSIANLGKIKGQIHRITCTSRLRQWGQAIILFASDHDDWLPMDGSPNGHSKGSNFLFLDASVDHRNNFDYWNFEGLKARVSPHGMRWLPSLGKPLP
tara:strand:+ start:281 stop:616 length:336 start_codon:yes stop_codon:yes gene_type:complete